MNLNFEYINAPIEPLFEKFKTSAKGLSDQEAKKRLSTYGFNEPAKKRKRGILFQIISKFLDPLVAVLLIIAWFSFALGERMSAIIVLTMAVISVFLTFMEEYRAGQEAEKLSEMVRATATVYRNGRPKEVMIREIVPGDVVDLFAGDMIPADLRIISCKDLFINQGALTGEAFPIEKVSSPVQPKSGTISELINIAFMGSSVVSGTALGLVLSTGPAVQFAEVSRRLATQRVETSFDKGIQQFTWLMLRFMFVLVVVIFAINAFLKGNMVEAFLFSLAVSIGLTPKMLPMLVAINLSKGAIAMSRKHVIVKRLNSIQNFGAMDVLCTDKTGTLTLDKVILERYCDVIRRENEDVLRVAYINSYYQTGLKNLLDRAILRHEKVLVKQVRKIDEIPFDFSRKIMSVVVESDGQHRLITKGAPEEIFKRCTHYELDGEVEEMEDLIIADLKAEFDSLNEEGYRVLALAYKNVANKKDVYSKEDESNLILKGYLAFFDPPKPTVKRTLETLNKLGIEVKVLTGDHELVTKKICSDVGINVRGLLTGDKLDKLSEKELRDSLKEANVLARLSPLQKERVIQALRANGQVVGYLGDGINDAPALKAADVGVSVNNAVDIAKESADIILLSKSLIVLGDGVREGRKTFGNILKYIKMGSSSNFGNMFSVVGGSLFLPFLPMAPIQILLNNFLYDLSQIAVSTDEVDKEYIMKPRPWDVKKIQRFMLIFGPLSSLFDFITFGVLLFVFHADEKLFHTGWFLQSLCTQTLVIHVIRTGKVPFIESMPSKLMLIMSLVVITVGLVLPFTPLADPLGFIIPPSGYFIALYLIVCAYLSTVQIVKSWFIKKYGND